MIETLIDDIKGCLSNGWTLSEEDAHKAIDSAMASLGETLKARLSPNKESRSGLRMSALGTKCEKKLWYDTNTPDDGETLPPEARLKFLYGDVLEELVLLVSVLAGHTVTGRQDELDIAGIKGHRDAVVDGVLVDVKSASPFGFKKFRDHSLERDDPFGYLDQLAAYHSASGDIDKTRAGFLAVDKVSGEICLDLWTYPWYNTSLEKLVEKKKAVVAQSKPPLRTFGDKEIGKSGNRGLGVECSYCQHKWNCWPNLRGFAYASGPTFLTEVKRLPDVPEFTPRGVG